MKKFTKLFLSCALVSVVATATAAMASADSVNITNSLGSYDTDTGKITLTAATLTDLDATKPVTFIAYEKKADSTTIADDDIVAIDQTTAGAPGANDNTGVKGTPKVTDDGKTYIVKVGYYTSGNDFTTKSGELKLSNAADVKYGDIYDMMNTAYTPDGEIDIADATAILDFANGVEAAKAAIVGDLATAADIVDMFNTDSETPDGEIDVADATAILDYANGVKTGIGLLKQYATE